MAAIKRNGFTLVESLMALAVFTISGLAFSSFVTISASKQTVNNTKLSVTQARAQILALIANRSTWVKNLQDAGVARHPVMKEKVLNPELACLRGAMDCVERSSGYDLTLTDQSGKIIVDAIDPSMGLTKDGTVCSGFSETSSNSNCPWRLKLKWFPVCPDSETTCRNPQVQIHVSMVADAQFAQTNNLSMAEVSLTLEKPKTMPAFAKRIVLITNSVHYNYGSDIEVDPTPFVSSENPGMVTFRIPKTVSARGGTVGMNGTKLTYSPKYNISPAPTEQIYGMDWFNYIIKDSYSGLETVATIYVQVMTPYTWTGLAGAGDPNITNRKNFCGMVIAGKCDGATFPNTFMSGIAQPDTNLVFNETCTNCDVEVSSVLKVASFETQPYFNGVITQKVNFTAGDYGSSSYGRSVWRRLNSFQFSGGVWDGQAGELFIPRPGEENIRWAGSPKTYSFFRVEGGTFKAPPSVRVLGSLYISNPAAFKHNNGTVNWMPYMQWPVTCAGDCFGGGTNDVEFWNLKVGYKKSSWAEVSQNVNGYVMPYSWPMRSNLENGFTVLNDLEISNVGESQLASRGGAGGIYTIKLYGNLTASTYNGGGDYSYGQPSNIVLMGPRDQTIFGQALSEAELHNPRNANCLPNIIVDKPSGGLIVKDTVGLGGDFILKHADSYDVAGMNLMAVGWNYTVMNLDLNGNPISGLYYLTDGDPAGLSLDRDMTVNKLYVGTNAAYPRIRSTNHVTTYLDVKGDAEFTRTSLIERTPNVADKVTLRFNGTGNQTVTADMLQQNVIANHFMVDKPSGTITFKGELGVEGDFIVAQGNTIFDPTFAIHNLGLSADGYGHRLRLSMWDPVNQVIPRLSLEGAAEMVSPIYVQDLTVFQLVHSHNTGIAFITPAQPLYVSKNFTVGERARVGVAPNLGILWSTTTKQQLVMNGTTPQQIVFNGDGAGTVLGTGNVRDTIDLQMKNTSATPLKIVGKGTIGKLTVLPGSTVDLDIASSLNLTGTVSGVLNKNGTSPAGTLTINGPGVINN